MSLGVKGQAHTSCTQVCVCERECAPCRQKNDRQLMPNKADIINVELMPTASKKKKKKKLKI